MCIKKKESKESSSRGMRRKKSKEMRAREFVCDSPSSAGEQRKDEQVINTAGCHPSALESFSYALPLISAELHTMETIHWPSKVTANANSDQTYTLSNVHPCEPLCRVVGCRSHCAHEETLHRFSPL